MKIEFKLVEGGSVTLHYNLAGFVFWRLNGERTQRLNGRMTVQWVLDVPEGHYIRFMSDSTIIPHDVKLFQDWLHSVTRSDDPKKVARNFGYSCASKASFY